MRTVKISKADSGIRLDKFLFKIMPDAPSGVIYKSLSCLLYTSDAADE